MSNPSANRCPRPSPEPCASATKNTTIYSHSHISHDVQQAGQWLQQGQLLAYPTESVWGIGCDAFDRQAVERILTIKQRPVAKGMIVVTDSVDRITALLASLPEDRRAQVLASWSVPAVRARKSQQLPEASVWRQPAYSNTQTQPQAHTWLLPLFDKLGRQVALPVALPYWITGEHDCVAVRVISHPLVQRLCQQLLSAHNPYGFLVSTSCNPAGEPPAQTLLQAQHYFGEDICYLQGDTLGFSLPSQIRDALTGEQLR